MSAYPNLSYNECQLPPLDFWHKATEADLAWAALDEDQMYREWLSYAMGKHINQPGQEDFKAYCAQYANDTANPITSALNEAEALFKARWRTIIQDYDRYYVVVKSLEGIRLVWNKQTSQVKYLWEMVMALHKLCTELKPPSHDDTPSHDDMPSDDDTPLHYDIPAPLDYPDLSYVDAVSSDLEIALQDDIAPYENHQKEKLHEAVQELGVHVKMCIMSFRIAFRGTAKGFAGMERFQDLSMTD